MATFEERTSGIILLVYWYRPASGSHWIMHTAVLATGNTGAASEEWFFHDPERMSTHIKLSQEVQRRE